MLETSPWSLRSRRSFRVLEELGTQARTGVLGVAGSGLPRNANRRHRAMALAEAGEHVLALAIETAAAPSGTGRGAKRVWKAVRPQSGARAAVFIAHGLGEIMARMSSTPGHHLNSKQYTRAREELHQTFPWSEEHGTFVREEANRIDPSTADGYDDALIGIAFHAIQMLVGERASELPGFRGVQDPVDSLAIGLSWQICFKNGLPAYLQIADPEGFARWEAAR